MTSKYEALRRHLSACIVQEVDDDKEIFIEAFELIRPCLFDYLFRMCGRRDTVIRVIDETCLALKDDLGALSDPEVFLLRAFVTGRSFSAAEWNADTSQLRNPRYESSDAEALRIEQEFGSLLGWEREVLLLSLRLGFSDEQIAKIMSITTKVVAEFLEDGLKNLVNQTNLDRSGVIDAVQKLEFYAIEAGSLHPQTIALSQIMGDIKDANRGMNRWKVAVLLLIIAGLCGAVYLSLKDLG